MFIVHVFVHVKGDCIDAFKTASTANATASIKEDGIARFDVIQDLADPTRFVLVEVYYDQHAPARHKETAHYDAWRVTVEPMMAEPRSNIKYTNVSPDTEGWAA